MSATMTSIGQTEYAERARKLISLIDDIRKLGAQEDIDLPRIAVIGNQSAGKSSLIEAISRIKVPRASGTCTRCPMECRLKRSDKPWFCQVSLRWERDENGARLTKPREVPFGPPLSDEDGLEVLLRRAQLAILNPTVESEKFVHLDLSQVRSTVSPLGEERQLSFSSNAVCVDISSPLLTDLSFIDLPGIISNVTEDEDENSITLIKDLVERSIDSKTLILLTITMRDDIQNQAAAMMARSSDPIGERTIGVLTKPDTLAPGELSQWIDVLSGKKHRLTHGYYITKQPGVDDLKLGLSFDQARSQEVAFFAQAPWSELDSNLRTRVGTRNLTGALSKLLSDLIAKSLPMLKGNARGALMRTLDALVALPPPPSSQPFSELVKLLTEFSNDVQHSVEGLSGYEDLMRTCREAYESFKRKIAATHPHLIPYTSGANWSITLEKDDDHVEECDQVVSEGFASNNTSPASTRMQLTNRVVMNLTDMRIHIKSSLTRELPLNVPYSAKVQLFNKCFKDWKRLSLDCFEEVHRHTEVFLNAIAGKVFIRYQQLCLDIREILEAEIQKYRRTTLEEINKLLALEEVPFTLNDHYYCAKRSSYLEKFKKPISGHSWINNGYEQELVMMAECEAYYRVAFKRIIDNLPRVIDQFYLKAISRNLQATLMEKFGSESGNPIARAKRYLQEDHVISAEREKLIAARDRLEKVVKALSDFNLHEL